MFNWLTSKNSVKKEQNEERNTDYSGYSDNTLKEKKEAKKIDIVLKCYERIKNRNDINVEKEFNLHASSFKSELLETDDCTVQIKSYKIFYSEELIKTEILLYKKGAHHDFTKIDLLDIFASECFYNELKRLYDRKSMIKDIENMDNAIKKI